MTMKKLAFPVKRQTGTVLILTMVALLTMTLLTATMMRASLAQMQIAANAQYSAQPMENAESILRGVEDKLDILDKPNNPNNAYCSATYGSTAAATSCNCSVSIISGNQPDPATGQPNPNSGGPVPNDGNAFRSLLVFPPDGTANYCDGTVAICGSANPGTTSCTCTCPEVTTGGATGLRDVLLAIANSYGNNPDGSPVVTINLLSYKNEGNPSGYVPGSIYREYGIIVNTSGVRGSARSVESRYTVKY